MSLLNRLKSCALTLTACTSLLYMNAGAIEESDNIVPIMVNPSRETRAGIEYINLRYPKYLGVVEPEAYRRTLKEAENRDNLPEEKRKFRMLSPIVSHLFTDEENEDGGFKLTMFVLNPYLKDKKGICYNLAVNNLTVINSDATLGFYPKAFLDEGENMRVCRYNHERGATLQIVSFPTDFINQRRNALIFYPGNTLEESILEEKFGTREVPELPEEAKKYQGRTNISALFKVKGDTQNTFEKGERIGFLVDIYTPPKTEISKGEFDYLWVKQYYGNDPRFPKNMVVRPYGIRVPCKQKIEKVVMNSYQTTKHYNNNIFAAPVEISGLDADEKEPLLGQDPSLIDTGQITETAPQIPLEPSESIPLFQFFFPIDESGLPMTTLPMLRFDEPIKTMNVNWGFRCAAKGVEAAIYPLNLID